MRAVLATSLFLVLVSSVYATLIPVEDYGAQTYSPGTQTGSHYDNCGYWAYQFVENRFYKSGNYKGKSIFINTSGGWIAAAEDTSATTVLSRYDLAGTRKKGSVKNTSTSTYYAGATAWRDNITGTIICV